MRLDDKVTVVCTDTDKALEGRVVRIKGARVDVAIGELLISLNQTKPGFWVGSRAGMEFTIRAR